MLYKNLILIGNDLKAVRQLGRSYLSCSSHINNQLAVTINNRIYPNLLVKIGLCRRIDLIIMALLLCFDLPLITLEPIHPCE
ncbi:hypothetical protein D3C78_1567540 [compost metagenome]